ncbi:MAG: hypothetical protein JWO35_21 [Candidatus Saccharibacteria bacterium]|nr:hypothetical protein [Candidatus Saccharibacteria bacterium]
MKITSIKLSKKNLAILTVLLVVVGAGIMAVRAVSAPSHGRITTSSSSKLKISSPKQAIPVAPASEVQTPYFQLALPVGYKQQSSSQTVPGLLYQQTIIKASSAGSLIIAIAITPLGSGLNDNSAYRLRTQDTARYKLTTQTVQGESIVIANDAGSSAVVAFWVHGDKLATISVTTGLQNPAANDNADELKALQPLLAAWQWQ